MSVRAAALAAALALALPLAACEGDDDEGKVVEGTGYEVTVPDGWRDQAENREDVQIEGFSPDLLLTGTRDEGFTSNVNVVVGRGSGVDLDEQTRLERRTLERGKLPGSDEPNPAQDLTPVERVTLDGEQARAYELALRQGDGTVRLRQVLTQHEGSYYVITLTVASDRFEEDRETFQSILDSWSWR